VAAGTWQLFTPSTAPQTVQAETYEAPRAALPAWGRSRFLACVHPYRAMSLQPGTCCETCLRRRSLLAQQHVSDYERPVAQAPFSPLSHYVVGHSRYRRWAARRGPSIPLTRHLSPGLSSREAHTSEAFGAEHPGRTPLSRHSSLDTTSCRGRVLLLHGGSGRLRLMERSAQLTLGRGVWNVS
jgi:hypothetical protein